MTFFSLPKIVHLTFFYSKITQKFPLDTVSQYRIRELIVNQQVFTLVYLLPKLRWFFTEYNLKVEYPSVVLQ